MTKLSVAMPASENSEAGKRSLLVSFHPETPDDKLVVSDSERGDFLFWQGNQGLERRRTSVRRTSKPVD